ncbi:MAG: TetR/AcrR family transcriptional regulator [Acetobacteraceae bacterium]|nr:TetR/AcrR family transcriptional regulator [Acetobacteraceae bacterium]
MPAVATAASNPSARRAEETRARIEETAERLFRAMGYQKTAVADIARELGMSPANVYRFFPSKSAINEAIAERLLGGLVEGAWAIARRSAPAPERLAELLRHLHAQHMALFFKERRLHDMVTAAMAEHWSVVERFIHDVQGAIRHVLADGMASGDFARLDPEQTARTVKQAIMIFNHPVLVAECVGRMMSEEDLATQADRMTAFILRALRP